MSHPSNKITLDNASEVVRYHKATDEQAVSHKLIADVAEHLIRTIIVNTPDCADRSTAIRCVREAKMWASAAIALEPMK